MESWHRNRLSAGQAGFVESRFPGVRLLNDLSWNLVDTTVLEVEHGERRYVVKAAGPANRHIGREIAAHGSFTGIWASKDRAPSLVTASRGLNLLVTEYLDGSPVEGRAAEYDADTYLQAGQLLRAFHAQAVRVDPQYEDAATAKAMAWLDKPQQMDKAAAEKARNILASYRPEPVRAVPTHGDWQPRNWLMNGTELRIIDFGRFEFRPALSDFCRLAAQQWRSGPELEEAFFKGYGFDPRESRLWNITQLREAVSTAAWAFQVGDREFEEQGHHMLRDALANY
ncbi:aminoglycoside phosphotransferase family protein [Arthrobacter sp. FW306-06-A]|uniref:aminoglycoside phosphotransferase family protein n=1 Tax=Arthrobacter sp. FW306-06-A TaxID=2879621 RepID=UPI001F3E19CD|nr:aminoglycoside phosphotransferase family protein [Arthrobacter sp. FW306-06-A]UKA72946.1 aminoglycoside phosphotransferase family protein [Arthrobacter sp. FW306-06-A]